MPEYKLPDVGEGLTEAEIVAWRVKVGDVIDVNDIVVDIETAKSIVELPSPYAGEVTALLVPEGETVPVGTPIIRIGAEDATSRYSGIGGNTPQSLVNQACLDIQQGRTNAVMIAGISSASATSMAVTAVPASVLPARARLEV